MKTFTVIFITLTLTSYSIMSQTVAFEYGQIIKKNKDTIKALIELSPTYDIFVHYKMNNNAPIQKIKIKEIYSLATPYNIFQNVALKKNELLFRLVITGNISLLEYSKININTSYDAYGGTMTKYGPPTIIYAVRTIDIDYVIENKKDVKLILPLLQNCPSALNLVNSKTFKLEDLEKVINARNACN